MFNPEAYGSTVVANSASNCSCGCCGGPGTAGGGSGGGTVVIIIVK